MSEKKLSFPKNKIKVLLLEKIDAGYTFLAFSLDTLFLGTICREEMKKLQKIIQ